METCDRRFEILEGKIQELNDKLNALDAQIIRVNNRLSVLRELFTENNIKDESYKKKWTTGRV